MGGRRGRERTPARKKVHREPGQLVLIPDLTRRPYLSERARNGERAEKAGGVVAAVLCTPGTPVPPSLPA